MLGPGRQPFSGASLLLARSANPGLAGKDGKHAAGLDKQEACWDNASPKLTPLLGGGQQLKRLYETLLNTSW